MHYESTHTRTYNGDKDRKEQVNERTKDQIFFFMLLLLLLLVHVTPFLLVEVIHFGCYFVESCKQNKIKNKNRTIVTEPTFNIATTKKSPMN